MKNMQTAPNTIRPWFIKLEYPTKIHLLAALEVTYKLYDKDNEKDSVMSSLIHLITFVILWPIAPGLIISHFDIDSMFLKILIFGPFFILALIISTLFSSAIDLWTLRKIEKEGSSKHQDFKRD